MRVQPLRIVPRHVVLAILVLAPLLAGCGEGTKRALGWEKSPPDEFSVSTRAPLTQPPDFDLRPPSPGATRPQEGTEVDQAKRTLLGPARATASAANPQLAGLSSGEQSLLRNAGADHASSDIRKQVDQETTSLVEESQSFTDDILFWQNKPQPGEVVNPTEEAKRLQSNASLGKPATEGDTPQIVRRQKGWLEDIF
jgi:hypothetical protein